MKRSSASDFKKNKKLCLSTTSPTNSNNSSDNNDNDNDDVNNHHHHNNSNNNTSTDNNINLNNNNISNLKNDNCTIPKKSKMTTTLEQIKDMILRLDKGDLDYCITRTLPDTSTIPKTTDGVADEDDKEDISFQLQKALKNIAQRQLKLETENKRYRIAIKQQHHLLTHDDYKPTTKDKREEGKESIVNKNKATTASTTDNGITPEDCISSFRTSPMLEKLQLSPPGTYLIITSTKDICYIFNVICQFIRCMFDSDKRTSMSRLCRPSSASCFGCP